MAKETTTAFTYAWFINQFEESRNKARELIFNTDDSLLLKQPAPEKWSAAECLSHLVEFGNIYADVLSQGIIRAKIGQVTGPTIFRPRFFWRWIIRFFKPPYKIKLKTIQSFKPQNGDRQSVEKVMDLFCQLQERFIDQVSHSREKGIDLSATKVSHPVLSFLKMTLSECLAVAAAHQHRHLWQAEQTILILEEKA